MNRKGNNIHGMFSAAFKQALRLNGMTIKGFCEVYGLDYHRIYAKICGKNRWCIDDILVISDILRLESINDICRRGNEENGETE